MRTDPAHADALPDSMTSWPLVQETLNEMDVSYQQAQSMFIKHGYPVGPTDRLPRDIVLAILGAEGYERERLRRV